jgi:hypothetical protein
VRWAVRWMTLVIACRLTSPPHRVGEHRRDRLALVGGLRPCRAEGQSFGCLLRTMGTQLFHDNWSEVMEPLRAAGLRWADRDARGRRVRRGSADVGGPSLEIEVVPGEADLAHAPALAEQQRDRDPQADRRCGGHELASVGGTQRTTFLHAHRTRCVHQVERVGGDHLHLDRLGEDLTTGLATAQHGVRSKPTQQRRLPRSQHLRPDVDDARAAELVDEVRNRLPVGRERRLTNLVTSNRLEPPVARLLDGRRDREPGRGRGAPPAECGDELVAPRLGERQ